MTLAFPPSLSGIHLLTTTTTVYYYYYYCRHVAKYKIDTETRRPQ